VDEYEYELRRGDAVEATGRIQLERVPAIGDKLSLGSKQVEVQDVLRLGQRQRLILRAF
jgi:hypothetical protein